MNAYRILISSVMDDYLKPIRKRIAEIVTKNYHVPVMAEDIVDVNIPKETIENIVNSCQAYIGVFHSRWGYIPQSDNPKKLSVTAIEFHRAKENNIPTLVLISDKEKEAELENFIKKISQFENGVWRSIYKNNDELYDLVYRGIPKLVEFIEKSSSIKNGTAIDFVSGPNKSTVKVKEVSLSDVNTILKNLQKDIDPTLLENQWIRLENIATNQRLWKIRGVWDKMNAEILDYPNKKYTMRAISILRKMIINSKKESDDSVIHSMKKYIYFSFLTKIFFDLSISDDLKIIIRDVFKTIHNEKVRFLLYWKYWKIVLQIKSDREFLKRTQVIMHDFKEISTNNRDSDRRGTDRNLKFS